MDWNWFFSSLAQSCASIVGLIGAFIISKILNNQSEFSRKGLLIQEAIINTKQLKEEINNKEEIFKKLNELETQKLEYQAENFIIPEKDYSDFANTYYNDYKPVPYQDRKVTIDRLSKAIDKIMKFRKASEPVNTHSEQSMNVMRKLGMKETHYGFFKEPPEDKLFFLKEKRVDLVSRINKQCSLNRHLFNMCRDNPESLEWMKDTLILLIGLFFVGVIYPLGCLPAGVGEFHISYDPRIIWSNIYSFRSFILLWPSMIFTGIVMILNKFNAKMKYDKDQIKEIEQYSRPEEFSEFLKFYEDNFAGRS